MDLISKYVVSISYRFTLQFHNTDAPIDPQQLIDNLRHWKPHEFVIPGFVSCLNCPLSIDPLSNYHLSSKTSITGLPFTANSDNLDLTLSLGLNTEVLLGVDILSGTGNIHAGVFMNLPTLSTHMSPLRNISSNCEASNSSTGNDTQSHIFPSLIHIIPSANIG